MLREEIEELRRQGLVGEDVDGRGRRLAVEVFTSPGGYILGEESALIECMEGHRGEPRNKPPFPGTYGLWGRPTLMNSVETLADVPVIVERGAPWWRDQGVGGSTGLKFFAVSGHVARPGVYCVPMGTTVGGLLEAAGGMADGAALAAVQPGGASSNFLGPDRLDVRLDFETLAEAGSMLGSGAMVVMAEGTDLLAAATNVLAFFRNESCGKCVPCRVGTAKAHTLLGDVLAGGGAWTRAPGRAARAGDGAAQDVDLRPRPGGAGPGGQRPRTRSRWCGRAPPAPELGPAAMPGHEFFTALTVEEALSGFRPGRRTAVEVVALGDALSRVPSEDVVAPAALPGFARSTVDGFAVRAADTYGVSDGLPGYLDVVGRCAWARPRTTRSGRAPPWRSRPVAPSRRAPTPS